MSESNPACNDTEPSLRLLDDGGCPLCRREDAASTQRIWIRDRDAFTR